MEQNLSTLENSLDSLKEVITYSDVVENKGFDQQYGWNQVYLQKADILNLIQNLINTIDAYGDRKLTSAFEDALPGYIANINRLTIAAKSHFKHANNNMLHIVPSIINTISVIAYDVNTELFSWENLEDKNLLPENLNRRLRSTKARLDQIDESSEDLSMKVKAINNAHKAAESLPTDLESLKEAKEELDAILKKAKGEIIKSKAEIDFIKDETISYKSMADQASKAAVGFKNNTEESSKKADSLVDQCDDALQITTTQGLAAGFDQKANELKNSIWVWIGGLLLALITGVFIGAERVEAFTQALSSDLTPGQAILHTIMSIFSIGGPLWLAWISTQQINQRFKLSEDYSYKATVAKSFTGFKKIAERFDSETEKRLFNSTLDRLDEMPLRLIQAKDYNSPWHEFMDSEAFNKAIDMVPTLAQEAGKFATKTNMKTTSSKRYNHKKENEATRVSTATEEREETTT